MNHPLGLDQIVYPSFEFPWPGGLHLEAATVEERMIEWGSAFGLIPNKDYRARVIRTRYGFLAARCYPRAGLRLLQAIADYFLWCFLADDLFVDRVDTGSADTIANLTAMIDVLDYNRHRAVPAYGETAWLDVCRRLRDRLSAEHCPITPDEYHQPAVQQMRLHANNIVCWSNDIQSLAVEARQPGQFRNMVTVYASQGRTLQEGVDITAQRVREEISDLAQLSEDVEKHANAALLGYITGMKDWTRGYQDWFDQDTKRYAVTHAARDADDRDITLP
jgi:hypothetical protein